VSHFPVYLIGFFHTSPDLNCCQAFSQQGIPWRLSQNAHVSRSWWWGPGRSSSSPFHSHFRMKSRLFLCLSLIRLYILAKHDDDGVYTEEVCWVFSQGKNIIIWFTFLRVCWDSSYVNLYLILPLTLLIHTRNLLPMCIHSEMWSLIKFLAKDYSGKYIAAYSLQEYLNVIPLGSNSSLFFCTNIICTLFLLYGRRKSAYFNEILLYFVD